MPTQSFQATAVAPAPVETAWRALHLAETWEGIAGVEAVSDATHDAAGHLVAFGFSASVGGVRYPGRSTVTHLDEPTHMRLDLTTSEVVASIDVRLDGATAETTVTVELAVRSRSFLAGMFFPAIADSIGRGLPATTADFARRLGRPG